MKTRNILVGILSLAIMSTATTYGQVTPAKTSTVKTSTTRGEGKTKAKPTSATGTKTSTKTATSTESTVPVGGGGRNVGSTTSGTKTNAIQQPIAGGNGNVSAAGGNPVLSADNPFKDVEAQAQPVVEETANGQINYTEQYIEAKGASVIDNDRFKNPAQARLMAERGAIVVAQRNLLEMVKGVNVIGETTVQDMVTTGDYVYSRVEGVVKGFKAFGPAREVNGTMEVTLRMPLYDNNKGVTAGFSAEGLNNVRRQAGLSEEATNIVQEGADIIAGQKPIAFTIAGQKIDPSMFPVIVDENGKVQLDFSKVYQKTGKVPKILQSAKDLFDAAGFKKGADVIELVQGKAQGTFTLADPSKKHKINWGKIGEVAGKIGKVLLNILL